MKKEIFNANWYFKLGKNDGDEQGNDFSDYSLIGLPHYFSIPYYGEDDFYVGYGCYYKKFVLSDINEDEILLLEFGAVFQVAEVFVNGSPVAVHRGGYTAFSIDITDFIHQGENTVFVRVNNLWDAELAPRAGGYTFDGGIYRDAYLISYPVSHISRYGVFVTSEKTGESEYIVTVTTETVNCEGLVLQTRLLNSELVEIAADELTVDDEIAVQKFTLKNPVLWDTENPYLYKAVSTVGSDSLTTEFGIRTIEWTRDNGFFLNGRRVLLEGANVHQDHGGWGNAVTHAGIRRDIALMKECGFNFIRGSHYPHHTEFARECDRQGILFWSESVFWGVGGFQKDGYWNSSAMPVKKEHYEAFERSLKQTTAEMIRQNRNSPSIIAWSVGNEMFFSKKSVIKDAKALVSRMVEFCHSQDSSRPAAVGGCQRGGFDTLGDIAGYNGDGAVLFKNPSVPSMVTEYGSIAGYPPGKYDLYETKGSNEYYAWRAGRAIWCAFHHGCISHIGDLGICDLYRLPLRAYFCHREKLRGIAPPAFPTEGRASRLKITVDKSSAFCDGTDDCMVIARVYDDNGVRITGDFDITVKILSGPAILPTGKAMTFSRASKSCFDGACAIEIRSYYAGKSTVEASCRGLKSDKIELEFIGTEEYCGQDIFYTPAVYAKNRGRSARGVDIIKDRPVAVSSERVSGSRLCLTSESSSRYWRSEDSDKSPHVILDMENSYDNFEIRLSRGIFDRTAYSVFVSDDKDSWRKVSTDIKRNRFLVKERARLVKLCFKGSARVRKIRILKA